MENQPDRGFNLENRNNNNRAMQNNMSRQNNASGQNNMNGRNNMSGQSNMSQAGNASSQNGASSQGDTTQQNQQYRDYGSVPVIFDLEAMAKMNNSFRTALWTGTHMQLALMSIQPGEDIGVEMHPDTDQFIRIEEGDGIVEMGNDRDNLTFRQNLSDDDALIIPAGSWHNVSNTGDIPLKAYTIYSPPEHPYGTVHQTKADADAAENE